MIGLLCETDNVKFENKKMEW